MCIWKSRDAINPELLCPLYVRPWDRCPQKALLSAPSSTPGDEETEAPNGEDIPAGGCLSGKNGELQESKGLQRGSYTEPTNANPAARGQRRARMETGSKEQEVKKHHSKKSREGHREGHGQRPESPSQCCHGLPSPPLLLNHLLFEGEFCFIRGKRSLLSG